VKATTQKRSINESLVVETDTTTVAERQFDFKVKPEQARTVDDLINDDAALSSTSRQNADAPCRPMEPVSGGGGWWSFAKCHVHRRSPRLTGS